MTDAGSATNTTGTLNTPTYREAGMSERTNKRPYNRSQDLTGRRFGSLVIVGLSHSKAGRRFWLCKCDCGREATPVTASLRSGKAKGCGCRKYMTNPGANYKRAEYRCWDAMKRRCLCLTDRKYPDYGGRGIRVCDRWRESFEAFLADVGPRPSMSHTLDRIDNDGHYEPGNVRWALAKTQANNRRSNRVITFAGRAMTMQLWAERFGLTINAIHKRLLRRPASVVFAELASRVNAA